MKECPRVCIFTRGVSPTVSPKSYTYRPLVRLGHALGSTATMRSFFALPESLPAAKGKVKPAKLEPPPVQPTRTSASSSARTSCFFVSRPMTVWCMRT